MAALGWAHRAAHQRLTAAVATERDLRYLHLATCLGLFCTGVYATSFGPALPFLAREYDVSLSRAGLLLTVFFVGSITASGSVAWRFHGFDARLTTVTGLGGCAVGAALLGLAPGWAAALGAVAVLGFGDGLLVAGSHNVMTQSARDIGAAINRLNVYFAVGAIAGPLWAGAVLAAWGNLAAVYVGIAPLCLVAAAVLLPARMPPAAPAPARAVSHTTSRMTPTIWVMGGILFLYVGGEFGLGSWIASYAERAAGAGTMTAATVTAGYWAALMLGRLISGRLFAGGYRPVAVLTGALAGALVASSVLALAGGSLAVAFIAAFLTGLCFGPIWPSAVTIAAAGSSAGAPATMVTIGNAGGIFFPWFQGVVLVSAGSSRGIAFTAALCLAMLAATLAYRIRAVPALLSSPPGR
jgi:fucose permease